MKARKTAEPQPQIRTHPVWVRAFVWVFLAIFAMSTLGLALFNAR